MKPNMSLFLILLSLVAIGKAQETWMVLSSGTTKNLNSISCQDANTCYVAGDSGVILKTTNGGAAWVIQASGIASTLNSIAFRDTANGCVAGDAFYKTTNGGSSWSWTAGGDIRYTSVQFGNTSAYVAGYQWACTMNGCVTVSPVLFPIDTGCALGAPAINSSSSVSLNSVYIYPGAGGQDYDYTWVVGSRGVIYRKAGTGSWTNKTLANAPNLLSVAFADKNTGWVVGDGGVVLKTLDGWVNWSPQSSGIQINLRSVRFADSSKGYIVGDSGTILRTTNGGSTWVPRTSGTKNKLNFLALVKNGTLGYAVGAGGIILKMTGGSIGVLKLNVAKGRLSLRYSGNPWYGFELPDNRAFNLLGRQPMKSFPLKLHSR